MNERVLTNAERAEMRRRTGQAHKLLALLQEYRAEVQQPCEYCGCMLYTPVQVGYRCFFCYPPLGLPTALRKMIEESMR